MSIIFNQEEDSVKYDLLKESFKEEIGYKINKNRSFSIPNQIFYHTKFPPKYLEHQISDWSTGSDANLITKSKLPRFLLPEIKYRRKSKNIEELSRQLLKYEQFNSDQNIEHQKFRLTVLKQMTKINFKRQTPQKQTQSPKKINIRLRFPQKYERYQLQNDDNINPPQRDIFKKDEIEQMLGQLYAKKGPKGLIPSIKKLVSSSFPKKSIFRSQSERDPQQRKKLLKKEDWENAKNSITDEIWLKLIQQQKAQQQRKVKQGRTQRRLPLNFLNYSQRKQSIEKERQKSQQVKKRKKSPYLSQLGNDSFYPKSEKIQREQQMQEHKRLRECILLNLKKKQEQS